ncbi:MAG: alanine-synthesizing transaminase [Bacteroidota bacterium]|nr:alanine-synthesizing transaminase [Bacteroidota bacterium]
MPQSLIIPAKRTENIKYAIRDITILANEVAKTGMEMLYLNIGDPNVYDFVTPLHVVNATYHAMLENQNGYSPSSGIKKAIEVIEQDSFEKGIDNILDIFITTGASEAIEICLTALLNSGDNFLMPTPGYPLYTAVQSKLELEPNPYYLDENNGWQPDIDDIKSKINPRTKAIVIINPNNPTGSICRRESLQQIIDVAIEHNLLIIADEIYDKLLFDGNKHISIASLNKDVSCVTFSGLSKNFMAPGFRIGWGVASGRAAYMSEFLEAVNKILRARICANHPEQYAIIAALEGSRTHIEEANLKLERRRDLTMEMLGTVDGISLVKPEGAFYAFPSIDVDDDSRFVAELIKATGVVVVPGSGFGQKPGSQHFRIVILPPEEVLEKSFKLIADFYTSYKDKR